jgi:hypothetical protein
MLVWLNSRVSWEGHSVLSKNLAEWLIWVSSSAGSRSFEVKIEYVNGVDISGSKLWAVNVVEETSSLPEGSNES